MKKATDIWLLIFSLWLMLFGLWDVVSYVSIFLNIYSTISAFPITIVLGRLFALVDYLIIGFVLIRFWMTKDAEKAAMLLLALWLGASIISIMLLFAADILRLIVIIVGLILAVAFFVCILKDLQKRQMAENTGWILLAIWMGGIPLRYCCFLTTMQAYPIGLFTNIILSLLSGFLAIICVASGIFFLISLLPSRDSKSIELLET
jgi:hypothetical protein